MKCEGFLETVWLQADRRKDWRLEDERGAESARVWKTHIILSFSLLHYSSLSYASPNDSLTQWQHAYLCERECVGLNSLGIKKERVLANHSNDVPQTVLLAACICHCMCECGGWSDWMTEKRAKEVTGLTWKKRDDALFGVLLPSLDWELVKKLHLGKKF